MRVWVLSLAVAAAAALPATLRAQDAPRLPDGVTEAMITEGQKLYGGQGICVACHGPAAKGIPNLGADLTDAEWAHSDGSYQGILATIRNGVAADKSTSGTVMPPKGGSNLSDDQLKAWPPTCGVSPARRSRCLTFSPWGNG